MAKLSKTIKESVVEKYQAGDVVLTVVVENGKFVDATLSGNKAGIFESLDQDQFLVKKKTTIQDIIDVLKEFKEEYK